MATTAIRVEKHRARHTTIRGVLSIVVALVVISGGGLTAAGQTPTEPGYRGFSYGTTSTPSPSGEKAQSKLWWAGGTWWGCLFNAEANRYRIYRLNRATHEWIDTEVDVDDRPNSKADVLWDGDTGTLYIVSNYFSITPAATSASSARWGRLYRYTYLAGEDRYILDSGFPVHVTNGTAEALTIARDSTGRLWVTWVESGVVKINYSLSNDVSWSIPSTLPVGESAVTSLDDISGVVAFGGGQVGVMWTNQNANTVYFAVHRDTDPFDLWQPVENVMAGCLGACADDHLNLKTDSTGRVLAVTKTSLPSPADPLIVLSVRDTLGAWTNSTVAQVRDDHTRPIVLVAEEANEVFVFASQPEAGSAIFYKASPLDSISFEPGLGTLFVASSTDLEVNNATSTKGSVNQTTGIVVLATDRTTRRYLHNELFLAGPTLESFSPASGAAGTSVLLSGSGFLGVTAVTFGGAAAAFVVQSDTAISTWVPEGASTGPIVVTNGSVVVVISTDFVVPDNPQTNIEDFTLTNGRVVDPARGGAGRPARITSESDRYLEKNILAADELGRLMLRRQRGTGTNAILEAALAVVSQPFGDAFASITTGTRTRAPGKGPH